MNDQAPSGSSAVKDQAHVSPDFEVRHDLLDGVRLFEVKNIVTGNGYTTEVFRPDWALPRCPFST